MLISVYGTLKKGFHNHGLVDGKYIKTTKISGYLMYDLGVPVAIPTNDPSKQILIEIYDVTKESLQKIRRLELGAGYKEINQPVDTYNTLMYIYNVPENIIKTWGGNLVPDGEWKEQKYINNLDDIELEYGLYKNDEEDMYDDWIDNDDWINDDDELIDYSVELNRLLGKDDAKDPNIPLYPLDPNIACECDLNGIKPSWVWDPNLLVWRCEKCNEIQEE